MCNSEIFKEKAANFSCDLLSSDLNKRILTLLSLKSQGALNLKLSFNRSAIAQQFLLDSQRMINFNCHICD